MSMISIYVNRYEYSDTSPAKDIIYVDLMGVGKAVLARAFGGGLIHLEIDETSKILTKATDEGERLRKGGAQEYVLAAGEKVMLDSTRISVMGMASQLSKSLCLQDEIDKVMTLIREAHIVGPDEIRNGPVYENWGDWK